MQNEDLIPSREELEPIELSSDEHESDKNKKMSGEVHNNNNDNCA